MTLRRMKEGESGEIRVPEAQIMKAGPYAIPMVKQALALEGKYKNLDVIVADEFVDGTLYIAWAPKKVAGSEDE